MADPILAVCGLHAGYGGTEILRGIDLECRGRRDRRRPRLQRRRQIDAQPRDLGRAAGDARHHPFRHADIEREKPAAIVARGLIHVPEGRHIFPNMTVRENLDLGAYRRARASRDRNRGRVFACFRGWPSARRNAPARCRAASSRCWRSAAA